MFSFSTSVLVIATIVHELLHINDFIGISKYYFSPTGDTHGHWHNFVSIGFAGRCKWPGHLFTCIENGVFLAILLCKYKAFMRTKGPLKRCMQLYELAVSHGMLPHLYMENKEVPSIHIYQKLSMSH